MNNPKEKPTLTGTRIKTRKRDEKLKEKRDPTGFRDALLLGLSETDDLEQLSKYLDVNTSKLDYRRYAEALFDILFAGGILAPGGSLLTDGDPDKPQSTDMCLFRREGDLAAIKAYYEVFFKLIRRYKYLEKTFEEVLGKLIMFMKGFSEDERQKLGMVIGVCLANNLGNPTCLTKLFDDHLVKDGLAVEFMTVMLRTFLNEKDIQTLGTSLKRGGVENRLLDLLPINKRTQEYFEKHFIEANLEQIVDYQRIKATAEVKKELQKTLEEMIKDEASTKEIIPVMEEQAEKHNLSEEGVVVMVWNTLMNLVEWNKKEELVAEQALKHLKHYAPLMVASTQKGTSQLALLNKIQDFCFTNMNFLKVFQKIIIMLYKAEVLSEDAILHWYRNGTNQKGRSVFVQQMAGFVAWLQSAEEEDTDEEED